MAGIAGYKFKSDFALRNQAIGRAEGLVEGEAAALVIVLKSRGISVSDEARERILGCTDEQQVAMWLARAATVESVDELFD